MKSLKKLTAILLCLIICLVFSTSVFAEIVSSENAKLEIVENHICTINIGTIAKFEKKITAYDLENKEITIGLTVKNLNDSFASTPAEVVLVIDNSLSMKNNNVSTDVTRLKAVTDSAKTLVSELYERDTDGNVNIAVVSFSSKDGNEGTLEDATIKSQLSTDKDTILAAIDDIATGTALGARTDIDAGLQVAKTCFSENNNNKYLVLLTDGVPNNAVGGPTITYSGEVATKTKATIESISNSGINLISCMIGLTSDLEEPTTHKTYLALSEEVFGTVQNPTAGKFYYVSDSNITNYICGTVLENIVNERSNTLTNLDIYDYFPQDILDNYNIEYVTLPTIGTVNQTIASENGYILWHFDTLKPGQTDSLSYKLTLKDEINSEIINEIIKTNKKVDITADEIKESDGSEKTISYEESSKIKVTIPEEKPQEEPKPDNTIKEDPLPQTGINDTILFIAIGTCLISAILFIRVKKLDK